MKDQIIQTFRVFITFFFSVVFLTTCEKPERNNPWDDGVTFDLDKYAPKNLAVVANSATQITLSWTYNEIQPGGFAIARKENNGSWNEDFATTQETSFTDNNVNLLQNSYEYRVHTFYIANKSSSTEIKIAPPTVTTAEVTDITTESAISGGIAIDGVGLTIQSRGVVWSTKPNPQLVQNKQGADTIAIKIDDENTNVDNREAPQNTKGNVENEQENSAENLPDNVNNQGLKSETSNGQTNDGSGAGSFTSQINGLDVGTQYYLAAYVTSSIGVHYGEVPTFTTEAVIPHVTTAYISDITTNSATGGGNVTSSGGATVTARGIAYSTSPNPTIAGGTVSAGSGTGSWVSELVELQPGTTYYVRAYATNSAGTAYGEQVAFTTLGPPTVTTSPITNITTNSATGGGNVTSSGGLTISARGIAFSTSPNPTTSDNTVMIGVGTGSFTANMTGLLAGTTYYVRAFAANSAGTAYGEQVSFNTAGTAIVNVLNPATGKTWMDRNLGASRAATSSNDAQAYGDLYQWGRGTDGHENRNSGTTSTLSGSNTPGHGNFIFTNSSPYDWRSPQNPNLWQGVNDTNNPCPTGYRLPTEAEWTAERQSWSSNNTVGAFDSHLKLPAAGFRIFSNGSLLDVGSLGYYWSSAVSGSGSRFLYFFSSDAIMLSSYRAYGYSVRCLKE